MTFATESPELSPIMQNDAHFAFARINGSDVHLVQASSFKSPIAPVDVKVFKHEFIYIFRLAKSCTVHPAEISFLETIDDRHALYEEEGEKVYLTREMMQKMQNYNCDPRFRKQVPKSPRPVVSNQRQQRQRQY
ncbi:hypothetical protein JR316_0009687 [Psilocybe cubensis]|uniref:Uncharacterized protein n=2 Tax=Psilocybe cubensis TaxID=181762 RepID=A0A8H8CG76_PSICU|nr:hypothetical protein JR316_0009687 [Psilocybe cubensis]KAH9477471.1 hypothetical protein JR316_0009687 [Psilocybe cubensis]